jgi:large subunit ribosomal protein L9
VALTAPIKELGLHDVRITLHPEVEARIFLNVARSPEEAELQAQGKTIQELAAEEEALEQEELAELFEDIGAAELEELDAESTGPVDVPEGGVASEQPDADDVNRTG